MGFGIWNLHKLIIFALVNTHLIQQYLRYYARARTRYRVHSPFVFELVNEVLEDERYFYVFEDIERLRVNLSRDKRMLEVTDLGAGSHTTKSNQRSVQSIARSAVTPSRYTQFLFSLVHYLKPKTLLEMGTSLGISTLYQAKADGRAQVITLEGCPEIAAIAQENFKRLKANNIELMTGDFSNTLPQALSKMQRIDYVFFDGNHRKMATLNYFHQALKYAHEGSVFVFDDIYWSEEMMEAWEEIKAHPQVTLTIDIFYMGIVFFRKEQVTKEHFTLIDSWKKPWSMGFFN